MLRRGRDEQRTPAELHRAPIVTQHLIVRESNRGDATELEAAMSEAGLDDGRRTVDGARRFDAGLHEVPVWSATRAVCEKGSMRILGGLVLTEHEGTHRIGWWLRPSADPLAVELLVAAVERLRAMGAERIVAHLRAEASDAIATAEAAGLQRGGAVQHTTSSGEPLEFVEFVAG